MGPMEFLEDKGGSDIWRGDCVVRALQILSNLPYKRILVELNKLAREQTHRGEEPQEKAWNLAADKMGCAHGTQTEISAKWMTQNGYVRANMKGRAVPVWHTPDEGAYVLSIRRPAHKTAVLGGINRDTWDCRFLKATAVWGTPEDIARYEELLNNLEPKGTRKRWIYGVG